MHAWSWLVRHSIKLLGTGEKDSARRQVSDPAGRSVYLLVLYHPARFSNILIQKCAACHVSILPLRLAIFSPTPSINLPAVDTPLDPRGAGGGGVSKAERYFFYPAFGKRKEYLVHSLSRGSVLVEIEDRSLLKHQRARKVDRSREQGNSQ